MIVAGFGYRSGATVESLSSALKATGYTGQISALATASDKTNLVQEFGHTLSLDVHGIAPMDLTGTQTKTQSGQSITHRNTGSVSEAAALFAAGSGASLISPRAISEDRLATCAIAKGDAQ